ncbi:MAG: DUF389 domain-containing protein [Bacteroidaceae bacterium]|nr:DUF389 domain-containing protein [Bacteroidaceae bacterium]
MEEKNRSLWQLVKRYFNMMPDKSDEQETIERIEAGVPFRGANLWVLVFAIFIASLGLNVNSTAVIIGAMLISPLMGPILGMGLAIGIYDTKLLKRSLKNLGVATFISVLTATIYFAISPFNEAQSELLARTSPTIYDVLIALFGGAAGIVGQASGGKGNVIPGVAIATALMPPLCTAGFGLATGNLSYFLGAFYLFYINSVFICLATFIGVKALKFSPAASTEGKNNTKVNSTVFAIAVLTLIPAVITTYRVLQQNIFDGRVNDFVDKELRWKGSQVLSYEAQKDSSMLKVVAVGEIIPDSLIDKARQVMGFYGMEGYQLQLIQGSANIQLLENELTKTTSKQSEQMNQLLISEAKISALRDTLRQYRQYEALSQELSQEIEVLYPQVNMVSLSRMLAVSTDTTMSTSYVVALIETDSALPASDRETLRQWLVTRSDADSLRLIVSESETSKAK